ncbi:MAG: hypothetical protein IIA83_00385 [Thaumarchaeota archaeon]|nr:hypothetical protein [Nitrososphaerota archaeon]
MTLDKKIRTAIICELKTYARPSDQKIADKMGVSRATVWNKRKELESDIVTYLGKDFINFRVKQMNRTLLRLQNQYDYLEKLKNSTNVKLVRSAAVDSVMHKVVPFLDLKHIPISASDKIRIVKEQVKIERMITDIITSGMLKAANFTPPMDDPLEK